MIEKIYLQGMRAAYFEKYGPPDVITIKDVPKPAPKRNEILVKVDTALLSMGDCEMRSPRIPYLTWFLVRLFFGLFHPRIKTLGSYFSGDVVEVGEDVSKFKVGDQVFGISIMFGAHAEYTAVKESGVIIRKPAELPHAQVAPLALGLDSLHFMNKSGVKAGDDMLINGAGGGIGLYAMMIAKHRGATVTAVDRGEKLSVLTEHGADYVINYTSQDFIREGRVYDIVFDVVGKLKHFEAMQLLKKKGYYISAIPKLRRALPNLWVRLFSSKTTTSGLTSGTTEDLETLVQLLLDGHITSVIDRTYPLEAIVDAEKYIEAEERKGNVLLQIGK